MQSTQHAYLGRLDHLRLLAASLVLLFHFFHRQYGDLHSGNPLISLIDEGHTGIALFMVISGFIFTVIAGRQTIDYAAFIRARIVRIYPLFIFAVFLQLFISTYNDQRNYGFLQLLGWLMPFRSDTIPLTPYFVQLWTIWIELQFYLLFPFLLLFSRRLGARYLWGTLMLLMLVRVLVFAATGSVRFIAYETIFGRLDQFIVGMLLGRIWLANASRSRKPASSTASLVALLLAALAALLGVHAFSLRVGFSELSSPLWIIWPGFEAGLWAAVLWTYLRARWPTPHVWQQRANDALASLGAMSYSVYVMHNLVIAALVARLPGLTAWQLLPGNWSPMAQTIVSGLMVVLPCVLVVSTLTYRLIERPFLTLRKPYLRDPVAN